MNSKSLFFSLLLLTLTPLAYAASVLELPTSVEVKVLNGQVYSGDRDIKLTEGENQIVFNYVVNYRDNGMQTQFNSNAVVLTFNAQNDQYELTLPTIRNKNAANKFNKTPSMTLTNKQGSTVAFQSEALIKAGLQIGRDYPEEMIAYNQAGHIASVPRFAPVAQVAVAPIAASAAASAPSINHPAEPVTPNLAVKPKTIAEDQAEIGEMLDYWYNKANDDTKAKFKAKINQ